MTKGIVGLFASLIISVVFLGAIMWGLHQRSHQMVVDAGELESLIDQQRETNRATLYSHKPR